MAVNAGANVIATARSQDRFQKLEALGARRVEIERPDLSQRIAEREGIDAVLDLVGNSTILDSLAMLRRGGRVPGGFPRRACSGVRFQPAAADVKRRPFQLFRQFCVRQARLSSVGRSAPDHR
jgi:Zinc-binding dehydrogenase